MKSWIVLASLALALVAGARPSFAQSFPTVTDRQFDIDLFEQPALGSPRLIGMAGAIDSVSQGAAGLYANPSSAAVRPDTKSDKLAWNIYFNSYVPADGQDANNNGQSVTSLRRSLLGAAGLLLQYGQWGLSLDGGYTAHEIQPQAGGGLGVRSFIGHIALARLIAGGDISLGIGARWGALNVYTLDMMRQTLFTRAGISGEAGAVWKPHDQNFRLALSLGLPVVTGALSHDCDPNACSGYILPSNALVPWDLTAGAAWRWGPTRWNHPVDGAYRDERSLTLALGLGVMGAVSNGYGMEAFAAKQLQPSGRNLTWTPRLGLEVEAIPGWLRVRGGSYLEPSRFAETHARVHGTAGAQGRIFAFHLLGQQRRVALSAAADVADSYQNIALSVGFWN